MPYTIDEKRKAAESLEEDASYYRQMREAGHIGFLAAEEAEFRLHAEMLRESADQQEALDAAEDTARRLQDRMQRLVDGVGAKEAELARLEAVESELSDRCSERGYELRLKEEGVKP